MVLIMTDFLQQAVPKIQEVSFNVSGAFSPKE